MSCDPRPTADAFEFTCFLESTIARLVLETSLTSAERRGLPIEARGLEEDGGDA